MCQTFEKIKSLEEIETALRLMKSKVSISVKKLHLNNLDISSISSEDIGELSSKVTEEIYIKGLTSHLSSILKNATCQVLNLSKIEIIDTEILVQTLDNVEVLKIGEKVVLDIDSLILYNGEGRCRQIKVWSSSYKHFGSKLKIFAKKQDWETKDINFLLSIERPSTF